MSLTTVKGPAPTGFRANAFAPSFLIAVGEAIQLNTLPCRALMNGAST